MTEHCSAFLCIFLTSIIMERGVQKATREQKNSVNLRRCMVVVGGRVKLSSWHQLVGEEWEPEGVLTFIATYWQQTGTIRCFLDVQKTYCHWSTKSAPGVRSVISVFQTRTSTKWRRVIRTKSAIWKSAIIACQVWSRLWCNRLIW